MTVKINKRGVFIEAGYDIFINELIKYDITNDELARFTKKKVESEL